MIKMILFLIFFYHIFLRYQRSIFAKIKNPDRKARISYLIP